MTFLSCGVGAWNDLVPERGGRREKRETKMGMQLKDVARWCSHTD